MAFPVPL
ncbi:hypothetical protein VCHC70A1_3243, partial [Vibrio cholerae HC-70A1]